MDSDELMLECEERMEKCLNSFKNSLANARTGRANPKMLDAITIEYYGAPMKISQLSSISVPEGNQLYIKPFDKGTLSLIEKALFAANLGVTPQNDGTGVRIILPPMTQENRMAVAKQVKKDGEDAKVVIRNVRQDTNNGLKKNEKDKEISEDELEAYLKDVQDLTDKYTKLIDQALDAKTKDIMTI